MTQVIITMVSPNSWYMGGLLGTRPARVNPEVQNTGPWAHFFHEPAQGRIFEWALLRGFPVVGGRLQLGLRFWFPQTQGGGVVQRF